MKKQKENLGKNKWELSLTDPEKGIPLKSADYINYIFTNLTTAITVVGNEWFSIGNHRLPNKSVDSVLFNLMNPNVNKAVDHHNSDIRIIKPFAEHFARPLAHIFNESFNERVFPDIWKISSVCTIPKSKRCCSVHELRPVALNSVLFQIQESNQNR